jgi:hypothetical protein
MEHPCQVYSLLARIYITALRAIGHYCTKRKTFQEEEKTYNSIPAYHEEKLDHLFVGIDTLHKNYSILPFKIVQFLYKEVLSGRRIL